MAYGKHIKSLDDLTARMLPNSTDSGLTRARKAISSVWHEKEVAKAWTEIEQYKSTFIFLFIGPADKECFIAKLVEVDGAAHNSTRFRHEYLCFPGTRVEVLKEIMQWCKGTS